MALINQVDKYHLCYLVLNDIADDCFSGLSHVAEHTLLMPSDIEIEFFGRGYTCANHVWLYFASEKLETLFEVDRQIMNCEIVTEENVNRAKCQVEKELFRLREHTALSKNLIRFITDCRIEKYAIGEVDQINQIQPADIRSWLEERKSRGQIYRYIFKDAHEMIVSTPVQKYGICNDKTFCDYITSDEDRWLILSPLSEASLVQIYCRIPVLDSKEAVIKKAVFEFCIQRRLQDAICIDIEIRDSFFDTYERFSVLKFQWNNMSRFADILRKIRQEIFGISSKDFCAYREEFKLIASAAVAKKNTNSEIMNAIKNDILYALPSIQPEDIDYIEKIAYEQFRRAMITKIPLKVVIL